MIAALLGLLFLPFDLLLAVPCGAACIWIARRAGLPSPRAWGAFGAANVGGVFVLLMAWGSAWLAGWLGWDQAA